MTDSGCNDEEEPDDPINSSTSLRIKQNTQDYNCNGEDGDNANDVQDPNLTYQQHTSDIFALTGPIVLSEIFQNTLPVVDIAFVGNLGKQELGAAALATVWFNIWNTAMIGFMTAIDTMLAQSHGAKANEMFAIWTANSIIIVTIAACVACGLVAICGPCMALFGQDPDLAAEAGHFSYRLLPGLIPYFLFKVLTKYLQAQNKVSPGVYIGLVANGVNVFFNWFFIYRMKMGLYGAPWATTATRIIEFLLIIIYIYWNRKETNIKATLPKFSTRHIKIPVIMPFIKLAISGASSIACEAWSFEITTILAGLLGTVQLDAHIITLTIATFVFLSFPFAVALATSLRVGQLVGEGSTGDAKRSCVVSYAISILLQLMLCVILFFCRRPLSELFSSDEDVSGLVVKLIPISCVFMLGDALQANTGGVLRGIGKQSLVLKMNIVGFWILAVPVGALITFTANQDIGVAGLWWGFVLGIYSSAALGIYILKKKINWKKEVRKAKLRVTCREILA